MSKTKRPVRKETSKPIEETPKKEVATSESTYYVHKEKPCFWKGKILINGALVSGRVTTAQMKHFFELAPKDIDLDKWLYPTDRIAERRNAAKNKMKKKLGLTD